MCLLRNITEFVHLEKESGFIVKFQSIQSLRKHKMIVFFSSNRIRSFNVPKMAFSDVESFKMRYWSKRKVLTASFFCVGIWNHFFLLSILFPIILFFLSTVQIILEINPFKGNITAWKLQWWLWLCKHTHRHMQTVHRMGLKNNQKLPTLYKNTWLHVSNMKWVSGIHEHHRLLPLSSVSFRQTNRK